MCLRWCQHRVEFPVWTWHILFMLSMFNLLFNPWTTDTSSWINSSFHDSVPTLLFWSFPVWPFFHVPFTFTVSNQSDWFHLKQLHSRSPDCLFSSSVWPEPLVNMLLITFCWTSQCICKSYSGSLPRAPLDSQALETLIIFGLLTWIIIACRGSGPVCGFTVSHNSSFPWTLHIVAVSDTYSLYSQTFNTLTPNPNPNIPETQFYLVTLLQGRNSGTSDSTCLIWQRFYPPWCKPPHLSGLRIGTTEGRGPQSPVWGSYTPSNWWLPYMLHHPPTWLA